MQIQMENANIGYDKLTIWTEGDNKIIASVGTGAMALYIDDQWVGAYESRKGSFHQKMGYKERDTSLAEKLNECRVRVRA